MKAKFVVMAAVVVCCWSFCLAFEPDAPFAGEALVGRDNVRQVEVAELKSHVQQLLDRVERLESQLAQVAQTNAAVQFTCDRSMLDSADKKLANPDDGGAPVNTDSVDEGMMIDALEHSRRRHPLR